MLNVGSSPGVADVEAGTRAGPEIAARLEQLVGVHHGAGTRAALARELAHGRGAIPAAQRARLYEGDHLRGQVLVDPRRPRCHGEKASRSHPGGICTINLIAILDLHHKAAGGYGARMKIAKPLLIVSTPLGVIGGLVEAYRLTGGLVILAAAMVTLLSAAAGTVVYTVRKEAAAETQRRSTAAAQTGALT